MKITAAVVHEVAAPFSIEELELDQPRQYEVLVRMVATGICHTDLIARSAPMLRFPVVLGHEGAGVVEQVGAGVTSVRPGDHVVLSFFSCANCANCRSGKVAYCDQFAMGNYSGGRLDGSTTLRHGDAPLSGSFFSQSSFASYALAHERNTIKVPTDVPLELLGPLGCGVQTGAGSVMNALRATPGSSIVVFGVGTVGLSAILAAQVVGCTTIIGVDINPQRLALARELGATHALHAEEHDVVAAIRQITDGGAHFAVEATGQPAVLRQAVDCLRAAGVCGLVGSPPFGAEVSLDMLTLFNGRTLRGIVEGDSVPQVFIPQLIELYRQGRFPFDRLITFYAFEQINQAAADTARGDVVKPVLRMM